jgi:diguanylate cyclase (GGDEF)-like protein
VDCVARYGGEEFAVLLVDVDSETAHRIAERFCRSLDGHPGLHRPVTASFGVCAFDLDTMINGAELTKIVDIALYKAQGRNCVVSGTLPKSLY